MRATFVVIILTALAGCHPSATVENTMPVANLQSYHSVALRVQSQAYAQNASYLQAVVLQRLQQQCGFEQVGIANGGPADVLLDLNITRMARGGDSKWIQNANVATIDTLLVLTDGGSGELLGTARIHGSSSGINMSGMLPEREAIDVVAKTVGDLLASSGCTGPRVAKVEPPPPTNPTNPTNPTDPTKPPIVTVSNPVTPANPGVTDEQRKQAEDLNHEGTDKLRAGDVPGSIAALQQAIAIVPEAKYSYNLCLALASQGSLPEATTACKQAKTENPSAELSAKIDHRLDLLAHHQ